MRNVLVMRECCYVDVLKNEDTEQDQKLNTQEEISQ